MSLTYYRFNNVILRSNSNSNIIIQCTHRAYEDLVIGCKRIADEYRFSQAPTKDIFTIEINGSPLKDSYNKAITV